MAALRWFIGRLILLLNALIPVSGIKRTQKAQMVIDQETASLLLYQFEACPFCVKVRRGIKRLGLKIENRDAKRCEKARQQLLQGGGKIKVPCLRIEKENGDIRWMYESSDILSYLQQRFGGGQDIEAACRTLIR